MLISKETLLDLDLLGTAENGDSIFDLITGVSTMRLGLAILQREGILALLERERTEA